MSTTDRDASMLGRALVGALVLPLSTLAAQAGQSAQAVQAGGIRAAVAGAPSAPVHAGYANVAMRIDGRLDERVWRAVTPTTEFVQREPNEGAPATHATDVRMLITDDAVVIGAHIAEDKSALVGAFGPPADGASGGYLSDYFEVQIDPHHDHVTAFAVAVTPGGAKKSWIIARDGTRDASWDLHWDAATHVDDSGWTVEIRIPLEEFHVKPGTESWGVQFTRFSWRRQETDVYGSTQLRAVSDAVSPSRAPLSARP